MAQYLQIPENEVITVEHPGIVKNINRAISSLGGHAALDDYLSPKKPGKDLYFYTRPEDSFRRPIAARQIPASNLMVRIEVPKLTGRKRKRGSDGPFEVDREIPRDGTSTLLRSLKDNPDMYDVKVVGEVKTQCRFLGLPDMQWSLASHRIAKGMKEGFPPFETAFAPETFHMLPEFYPDLQSPHRLAPFVLDPTRKGEREDMEIAPPATFLVDDTPFDYQYAQALYSRTLIDSKGNAKIINNSVPPRSYGWMVDPRVKEIPTKPRPNIGPEASCTKYEQDIIKQMQKLFEKHPIYTRRKLRNALPEDLSPVQLRNALQYCAYLFKAGPWKDCYIKLGVDPRADPEYRAYQSIAVRFPHRESIATAEAQARMSDERDRRSHVFTGTSVRLDGKVWALVDITDSLLRKVIDNAVPRSSCDTRNDGWLQNCTMAKIRTLIRHKTEAICDGVKLPNKIFDRILSLPETLTVDELESPRLRDDLDEDEFEIVHSFKSYLKANSTLRRHAMRRAVKDELEDDDDDDDDDDLEDDRIEYDESTMDEELETEESDMMDSE